MAIYDCFCFFNEIDILEARLRLLDEKIDFFVIAEAEYTHSGKVKGFMLESFRERLDPWWRKIVYIKVKDKGMPQDTWYLENVQRNRILEGINPDDDDIILISDIDEIPFPSKIPQKLPHGKVKCFLQNNRYYFFDCAVEGNLIWEGGTKALSFLTIKDDLLSDRGVRYNDFSFKENLNKGVTLTKVRLFRHLSYIFDGGYHLGWMGGVEAISKKVGATSHQEINTDSRRDVNDIKRNLKNHIDPLTGKNIFYIESYGHRDLSLMRLLPASFSSSGMLNKPSSRLYVKIRYRFELLVIILRNFLRRSFDRT